MTGISKANLADQIAKQLPLILGRDISHIQPGFQDESLPGTVLRISFTVPDQDAVARCNVPLILKRQDNDVAYRLYQQILEPFNLNSPKQYGYLELDNQRFLVMDYIEHLPVDWGDRPGYLKAVKWLVKKDLISMQNMESVRKLDCLGEHLYYGVDYSLVNFDQWRQDSPDDNQAQAVWRCVNSNQNKIRDLITELDEVGAQTVVHGDLSLDNILFVESESDDEFYVIDWTQPHLSSVTKDLVDLVESSPANLRSELIETYRRQIDFAHFEEIYANAKVLRDIGYCSWLAWMINVGHKAEIDPSEIDRLAVSLLSALADVSPDS